MTLLKMSIYGAVIILAVLIIRAITLHKLPKRTFLILWAVALLRLLVPFEISSELSLYSFLPEVPEEVSRPAEEPYIPDPDNPYEPFETYTDYLQIGDDDVIIVEQGGTIYLPVDNTGVEAIPLPDTEAGAEFAEEAQEQKNTQINTSSTGLPFLPALWATGVFLCAVFFLITYIRCRREFNTALPVAEEYAEEWLNKHPLKRKITIRQSDKISAPLTYGIFHPVILLPKKTDWQNTTQLDYVLYHEFTHIRRFDLLAKLVMIAALCLHWFNPFVWAMYVFFNRDLELSCDDCVVKHFNQTKSDYAKTLIGMEERKNYGTPLCNHFSKNAIEERITAIMKSKKTTTSMIMAAIVIILIVIITLTTGRKEEDVATDITPTPTETVTPAPTGSDTTPVPTNTAAKPTPPPGQEFYYPERNYTYRQDDFAEFEYNSSTISPKDGYDFTISSLVSAAGKNILNNLTINLEEYAGNTAWWCLAAFYDGTDNNVYLEFVPAAGVEDAPSGILHVTIPVTSPDEYTVHPAGDFHAQKASAFWFGEICKIQDNIYFNTRTCDGSLWVYDISTGEMSDLTYVNEKMLELARELCADFGWEHDPAIWHTVGWHSYDGIITYEADVCKEMDLGTFYLLRVYYKDGQFLDYSHAYKGAQEAPPTQEELNTQLQELFFRYQDMQKEFFYTNLKVASDISANDWVTINGTGGYTKVLDERFPTLRSVFDYMETICTPQFAMYLRDKNWKLSTTEPVVTEHNGMLYTRCYDGVTLGESYRFFPVNYDNPNSCTLSYEAYLGIPSNKTESGTIYFEYTDGSWHVSNHSYTYYHDYVDGMDIKIMEDLFSKYRTMWSELFNSNLECGYYSHPAVEDVTIHGISGYYKVLDERFPTMQSLIDYMETIYTPEFAAELRKKYYLSADSDYPLLAEKDGVLYTQVYHSSTNGYTQEFQFTNLQYNGSDTATVSYQTGGTIYPNIVEMGTITFRVMERGGWHIADLDYSYKNIATEGIFEDTPSSPPTTTGPDWYNAVSELMNGNTPADTTALPHNTVVPAHVISALSKQAESYLARCGLGTTHYADCYAVCKTGTYTVYAADISYSSDYNCPIYFTVYHAYDNSELVGKVIFRHQITFYDTENQSHAWANYITLDDVVTMAREQFAAFYSSKGYTQPYEITSIHMTGFDSMEVKFLLSESDNFEIFTEGIVDFTYDFASETWSVSSFRETPPDYLTSFLEFPELTAEDVVVTGKDWCLTFLDETELPRFQELMDAGGTLTTEINDSRFPEEGSRYIITLDGIGYYFYSDSAPTGNHRAWNVYILFPDYPLSGGAKVGMTAEELLSLYPKLAKTGLSGADSAFKGTYGSDHFAFRDDQFPESFLKEYEYAYVAYLDKERDGLPVCIAFLMANGQVGAITVYMPTAG